MSDSASADSPLPEDPHPARHSADDPEADLLRKWAGQLPGEVTGLPRTSDAADDSVRIDPLSVARSGLVDADELPPTRAHLFGRRGPRRPAERRPDQGGTTASSDTSESEESEGQDPLAVLRRALGTPDTDTDTDGPAEAAETAQTEAPSAADHLEPAEPAGTGTAATEELPAALVELAAAADEPIRISPRRRGTFPRRRPTDPEDAEDAASAGDADDSWDSGGSADSGPAVHGPETTEELSAAVSAGAPDRPDDATSTPVPWAWTAGGDASADATSGAAPESANRDEPAAGATARHAVDSETGPHLDKDQQAWTSTEDTTETAPSASASEAGAWEPPGSEPDTETSPEPESSAPEANARRSPDADEVPASGDFDNYFSDDPGSPAPFSDPADAAATFAPAPGESGWDVTSTALTWPPAGTGLRLPGSAVPVPDAPEPDAHDEADTPAGESDSAVDVPDDHGTDPGYEGYEGYEDTYDATGSQPEADPWRESPAELAAQTAELGASDRSGVSAPEEQPTLYQWDSEDEDEDADEELEARLSLWPRRRRGSRRAGRSSGEAPQTEEVQPVAEAEEPKTARTGGGEPSVGEPAPVPERAEQPEQPDPPTGEQPATEQITPPLADDASPLDLLSGYTHATAPPVAASQPGEDAGMAQPVAEEPLSPEQAAQAATEAQASEPYAGLADYVEPEPWTEDQISGQSAGWGEDAGGQWSGDVEEPGQYAAHDQGTQPWAQESAYPEGQAGYDGEQYWAQQDAGQAGAPDVDYQAQGYQDPDFHDLGFQDTGYQDTGYSYVDAGQQDYTLPDYDQPGEYPDAASYHQPPGGAQGTWEDSAPEGDEESDDTAAGGLAALRLPKSRKRKRGLFARFRRGEDDAADQTRTGEDQPGPDPFADTAGAAATGGADTAGGAEWGTTAWTSEEPAGWPAEDAAAGSWGTSDEAEGWAGDGQPAAEWGPAPSAEDQHGEGAAVAASPAGTAEQAAEAGEPADSGDLAPDEDSPWLAAAADLGPEVGAEAEEERFPGLPDDGFAAAAAELSTPAGEPGFEPVAGADDAGPVADQTGAPVPDAAGESEAAGAAGQTAGGDGVLSEAADDQAGATVPDAAGESEAAGAAGQTAGGDGVLSEAADDQAGAPVPDAAGGSEATGADAGTAGLAEPDPAAATDEAAETAGVAAAGTETRAADEGAAPADDGVREADADEPRTEAAVDGGADQGEALHRTASETDREGAPATPTAAKATEQAEERPGDSEAGREGDQQVGQVGMDEADLAAFGPASGQHDSAAPETETPGPVPVDAETGAQGDGAEQPGSDTAAGGPATGGLTGDNQHRDDLVEPVVAAPDQEAPATGGASGADVREGHVSRQGTGDEAGDEQAAAAAAPAEPEAPVEDSPAESDDAGAPADPAVAAEPEMPLEPAPVTAPEAPVGRRTMPARPARPINRPRPRPEPAGLDDDFLFDDTPPALLDDALIPGEAPARPSAPRPAEPAMEAAPDELPEEILDDGPVSARSSTPAPRGAPPRAEPAPDDLADESAQRPFEPAPTGEAVADTAPESAQPEGEGTTALQPSADLAEAAEADAPRTGDLPEEREQTEDRARPEESEHPGAPADREDHADHEEPEKPEEPEEQQEPDEPDDSGHGRGFGWLWDRGHRSEPAEAPDAEESDEDAPESLIPPGLIGREATESVVPSWTPARTPREAVEAGDAAEPHPEEHADRDGEPETDRDTAPTVEPGTERDTEQDTADDGAAEPEDGTERSEPPLTPDVAAGAAGVVGAAAAGWWFGRRHRDEQRHDKAAAEDAGTSTSEAAGDAESAAETGHQPTADAATVAAPDASETAGPEAVAGTVAGTAESGTTEAVTADSPAADARTGQSMATGAPTTPATPSAATPTGQGTTPSFVEYRSSEFPRVVMGAVFVAAAVGAVMAIFFSVQDGSTASILLAASLILISLACWWGLLSWSPRVISVSQHLLEVAQGAEGERFDLSDPHLDVVVGDDPASRDWTTRITRPNGSKLVIKRSQVRARQFSEIVHDARERARQRALDMAFRHD